MAGRVRYLAARRVTSCGISQPVPGCWIEGASFVLHGGDLSSMSRLTNVVKHNLTGHFD